MCVNAKSAKWGGVNAKHAQVEKKAKYAIGEMRGSASLRIYS